MLNDGMAVEEIEMKIYSFFHVSKVKVGKPAER
jgi:hypothetical protein